ncbi:MAG TPA: VWA domain-containing protein [Thermoanaerobaculia bacterium]|nr:VWA domain-containing protein [Thermoanaerobaculia bacterium]
MHRRLLALGILLVLTSALHAQKLRDAVTVEVVDVPVFVSHGDQPVEGLTRDDFELYVNGQRQPIDYFDVVSPAAERTMRERRLFLLVFDAAFSRPHALVRAQKAAARLIAAAPESDLFAIATFTTGEGVQFAVPFTADHEALQRAVASLTVSKSGDPLAIVMTPTERESVAAMTNNIPTEAERLASDFLRELAAVQIRRRAERQINVFEELSRRLSSLEGQKHVVLMTEGFEGYSDTSEFISRRTPPPAFPQTSLLSIAEPFLFTDLRAMYRAFQQSDVFLHTLDLEGLQMQPVPQDAHHLLALGTGGEAITNGNDVARSLARLSTHFAHGYRLGFHPQNVRAGHNSIAVKVRNGRGLTVRHRLGFAGTPQETHIGDGLYLADVVLNDVPQTGTAAALSLRDGVLHASVPLQPLAAQLGESGDAQLLVYVFDANGKAIAYHEQTIAVPANAEGQTTFDFPLPADAKVAKALLRVDDSVGFTRIDS